MSIPALVRPRIDRGVSRRDTAATAWFAEAGIDSRPSGPFRVVADTFRGDGFEATRIWHSPGRLHRPSQPGTGLRLLIPLEGTVVVQPDDPSALEVQIAPGDVAFLRCAHGYTLVTSGPTARIEILLGRPLLGLIGSSEVGAVVTTADPASRGILLSAVNATFGSPLDVESAAFPLVRAAIEQLAGAVLAASVPRENGGSIYARASALIGAMAADPRLSVQEICERTGVPKRTLQRVFAKNGTTVFAEIRRARLATARTLLGSVESPPPPEHALSAYMRSQRLRRDLRSVDPEWLEGEA